MIRINLYISFHTQVEQGNLSIDRPPVRVSSGQPYRSHASNGIHKFWSKIYHGLRNCYALTVCNSTSDDRVG